MKLATTMKTLALSGLTVLTLGAAPSQAEGGFVYFGGNPNANPWLNGPAAQQARYHATMRERLARLDQRQEAQLQRILGGMENGKLTMREATGLLREHLVISTMERNYMIDGRLGPNELRDLEQRLEEANRHIAFENNDRDQRGEMGRPGEWERPGDRDRRDYR